MKKTDTPPIEIQEPGPLDVGPPSPAEAELISGWQEREALPGILDDLKGLHAQVETIHEKAAHEAARAVAESSECQHNREEGLELERLFGERDRSRKAIRGNPKWSDQHILERLEALDEAFHQEIARRREKQVARGQTLKVQYGRQRMPPPSPEIAAEGSLALQRLPHVGGITLIHEVSDLLRTALDEDISANEVFRANQLLNHVYRGPLATRAMGSGPLQPAYKALSDAVERHFDVLTFGPRHRVASEIAVATVTNYDFLANTFRSTPWDPDLARMSTGDVFTW